MALEAVVYPQTQDPFGSSNYGSVKLDNFYNNCNLLGNWGGYEDLNFEKEEEIGTEIQTENINCPSSYGGGDWNSSTTTASMLVPPHHLNNNELQETSDPNNNTQNYLDNNSSASTINPARPKRRRARSRKNKEEIENQRMTHIAVERNRRKQMNEYLSVLRSLMPDSYIQRGDQASIIGGAINFVKELEQRMHFLDARKEGEGKEFDSEHAGGGANMPFSEFFSFPQYSSTTSGGGGGCDNSVAIGEQQVGEVQSQCGIADIEVTMVESHANLKIRSKKRPKQLLKMVSGLHNMRLTILHLNVTTTGEIVLYSLSVKVEDDCKLGSVDDIAAAVYQMLDRIQQEAMLN